jgi:hypothetical protein
MISLLAICFCHTTSVIFWYLNFLSLISQFFSYPWFPFSAVTRPTHIGLVGALSLGGYLLGGDSQYPLNYVIYISNR